MRILQILFSYSFKVSGVLCLLFILGLLGILPTALVACLLFGLANRLLSYLYRSSSSLWLLGSSVALSMFVAGIIYGFDVAHLVTKPGG